MNHVYIRPLLTAGITALTVALSAAAQAAPITITGNFEVTSTSANLVSGDLGGTLSDHGKDLNVPLSLGLTAQTPVSHALFGVNDLSIAGLETVFSNLSDGTAATSCTGDCTATGFNFFSFISLTPSSFVIDFADGGSLQIVDHLFDTYEQYSFNFAPPSSGVPEPLSIVTLGLGLAALGWSRRRSRAHKADAPMGA